MTPSRWIQILLIVTTVFSLAAAGFVFVAYERNQPLAADELHIYTDELRSSALSGVMLSDLAQSHKVTRIYFENECGLLLQNTTQNEESLRQEQPEQVLQSLHSQSIKLGSQVVDNLTTLCSGLDEASSRNQSQKNLTSLAQQLDALQKHL